MTLEFPDPLQHNAEQQLQLIELIDSRLISQLVRYGLIPNPDTGLYQKPEDIRNLDMLRREYTNLLPNNGGLSSDAKPEGHTKLTLTVETGTTAVSSSIFLHGEVTGVDQTSLLSILTKCNEKWLSDCGIIVDGLRGRDVVETLDTVSGAKWEGMNAPQ